MSIESTKINRERYEKLTLIPFDRPVDPFWTKKYRLEIEHNGGQIPQRTEWCITINEKGQILNGKNRRAAVMQYNELHPKTPIKEMSCFIEPYYIGEDANLKRAQELNNKKTKWTDDHYIGSFVAKGDEDYIKLQDVLTTPGAKKCARKTVYLICSDLNDTSIHKKVVKGEFEFSRKKDDAKELIAYVADCKKSLHECFGHSSISIPVFLRAMIVKDVNRDHLAKRVNKHGNLVITYSNNENEIMRNLNKVYNAKLGGKNEVEHLDLVDGWETVKSYNHIQKLKKNDEPKKRKRTDIPVIAPTSTVSDTPKSSEDVSKIMTEHKQSRDIMSMTNKKIVAQVIIPPIWMDYNFEQYGPAI